MWLVHVLPAYRPDGYELGMGFALCFEVLFGNSGRGRSLSEGSALFFPQDDPLKSWPNIFRDLRGL